MSFDFYAQEQAILAQLAGAVAATGIAVQPDADVIDVTSDDTPAVGAQVVFLDFFPDGQVGATSRHFALWAVDTYIDSTRATSAEKTAIAALFSQALAALIGWEIAPGRLARAEKVERCGEQGRIRRRSFGFILPVYLAG